jgi:hypothetical protein
MAYTSAGNSQRKFWLSGPCAGAGGFQIAHHGNLPQLREGVAQCQKPVPEVHSVGSSHESHLCRRLMSCET